MLFRRRDINKAISVAMLVTLLLVHSVKLLHAHNGYYSGVCKSNCSDSVNDSHVSSSDCGICSYQLGKDADDIVCCAGIAVKPAYNDFDEHQHAVYKNFFISFFESRGPPSCL